MRSRVVCCGNAALDLILDEKPAGAIFHARLGGSVTNTSILARHLGAPVTLITRTGDDFLGNNILSLLRREKIDTFFVRREKKTKTPLAFAKIDKKGDSTYVFYAPEYKRDAFSGDKKIDLLMKRSAVFHTGSNYSYDPSTSGECLRLLKKAEKNGLFTTYDPNWRPGRVPDKKTAVNRIKSILRHVDLLKLGVSDAVGISGVRSIDGALKKIGGWLKGELVVTNGAKGSFWLSGKKKICCPAFKIRVVDTIGAGDAFTAGLIYGYLLSGKEKFLREKKRNLVFASAAAALACTARGAVGGLKNKQQVMKFIEARYFFS